MKIFSEKALFYLGKCEPFFCIIKNKTVKQLHTYIYDNCAIKVINDSNDDLLKNAKLYLNICESTHHISDAFLTFNL